MAEEEKEQDLSRFYELVKGQGRRWSKQLLSEAEFRIRFPDKAKEEMEEMHTLERLLLIGRIMEHALQSILSSAPKGLPCFFPLGY